MKKFCIIILLATTISSMIPFTQAIAVQKEKVTNEYNIGATEGINPGLEIYSEVGFQRGKKQEITYSSYNGYDGSIFEVDNGDECGRKFIINEMGEEYELILDEEHNQAKINNVVYSYENFLEALRKQNKIIINNKVTRENTSLVSILKNYPSEKCTSCGKYSPMSAPTGGYKSNGSTASTYLSNQLEATVSAAGFAAGALVLSKVVGVAVGITGAFTVAQAKIIITKAISMGVAIGRKFNTYYKPKLYYHSTCPKAVKMYKSIYFKNGNGKYISAEQSANLHYYYVNPN